MQKHDLETKRKEELAKNPEKLSDLLAHIQQCQDEIHARNAQKTTSKQIHHQNAKIIATQTTKFGAHKSFPRTKQLAGRTPRCSPLKSHGSIVKPFKPPGQTSAGVEYFERNGETFTTLRQLEAAIRKNKKKKTMDKGPQV